MLKNLKHSILFILLVITLLLVVFVSLAAFKPVSIDTATVNIQKENNIKSGKWSGLGINVSATSDNLWQLSDFFGGQIDDLLANGFNDIRVDLANWANDTAIERSKASVIIAVAKGANVIWGVSSGAETLTAANWADYCTKTLELAQWAQDNGVYEFQIGNEEEEHNDDATLTDAQLRANLRTLATDVQAVFTRGKVSYCCVGDVPKIAPWIAEGKGDTDLLAFNSYQGGVVFGDSWKTVITNMVNTFGVDGTYISEFSLSGTSLASWSADEAVQASGLAEMIDYIKTAGIERALFFTYYDDPRPWNPEGFGVLKTDGTYRLLWDVLTSNAAILGTTAPNITGLSDDTTPTDSKTWTWDADEPATFRYLIDDKPDSVPTGDYSDTKTATQSGMEGGTYYIHVQAKDAAGNESEVVTVSAIINTSTPNIAITPASKAFGSVDISSSTNPSQTFTIQNTGSANLAVGTITITGTDAAQFVKSGDNASGQTIAAGASRTITVTFDPTTTGEKTAILSIPLNDPDTPTLTADLTGTGSNNIITGSIVLTETGLSSGVSAGFTLYDNNNQAIGSENIVSGPESLTVTWTNVPYGSDYKIVETTVPAGYIKMPDITNISITTQGQTVNITVNADVERTAPNIIGLSNDTAPTESKTWTWDADEPATFRYLIDDKPDSVPAGDYTDTKTATQSGVEGGTYYIHVQAKDAAGNESVVVTVSAILVSVPDTTAPDTTEQTDETTQDTIPDTTAPEITGLSNDTAPTDSNETSSSSVGLSSSKGIQQYEDPVKAFVARFYQECLSRDPDNGGLNGWADDLTSGAKTGAKVAYGFIFNDEFKQKNVSNEEYITILYRAFFNREPDSGGFNNWLRHLNNGKSRKWVLAGFIKSKEFKNLCAAYGIKPGSI